MHSSQQQKFKMTLGDADDDNDDGGFETHTPATARYQAASTRHQHQKQQQHQHQRLNPNESFNVHSSEVPRNIAPPVKSHTNTLRRIQLGNKDLIIRMLAEIFQVRQDENGLVRWQQISTSLVPISLYSRTTSKWLDYLLAASASSQQTGDPSNAMSPDSRDFLLLLQQFHQQTRPKMRLNQLNVSQQQSQQQQQNNEFIVFQVVGHDYLNGQCKKILNVKIKQPSTRLGQASDYFVYWREQSTKFTSQKLYNLHSQHFSASSFASSTSFMPPTLMSAQMLNQPATNLSQINGRTGATASLDTLQTWGLNFASINDAKLFYDICSLNLVDLDFNSEYLKQLATSDAQYQAQNALTTHKIPMATNAPYHLASNSQGFRNQQQRLQMQQQQEQQYQQRSMKRAHQNAAHNITMAQNNQCKSTLPRGQSSMSRCPSCKRTMDSNQRQLSGIDSALVDSCPIHSNNNNNNNQTTSAIRMRSRSTTRQSSTTAKANESLKRTRSFSTPASPEHEQCPVHNRRHRTNTECEHVQNELHQLQPKRLLVEQQLKYGNQIQDASLAGVPQKPARGLLRTSQTGGNSQGGSSNMQTTLPPHFRGTLADCEQTLGQPKMVPKSRTMDYSQGVASQAAQQYQRQQMRQQQLHYLPLEGYDSAGGVNRNSIATHLANQQNISSQKSRKQQLQQNPSATRSLQRTQVNAETFDTMSRRNARLARARYANSKNMKEFLSLDAGGVQMTPTQQRFQRHQTKQQQQQQQQQQQTQQLRQQKLNDGGIKLSMDAAKKNSTSANIEPDSIEQRQRKQTTTNKEQLQQTAKQSIQSCDGVQQRMNSNAGGNGGDQGHAVAAASTSAPSGPLVQSVAVTSGEGHENSIRCNVSTTTEDLPMDNSTRQRMLKLTSDEVISERTEPKSISTASVALDQAQLEGQPKGEVHAGRDEKIDRQVRAVSLGPGLSGIELKTRGRGVRSDAGRRRSLERSGCVDLDSTLPVSSFVKYARLSPLPQSATPSKTAGEVHSSSRVSAPLQTLQPENSERLDDGFLSNSGNCATSSKLIEAYRYQDLNQLVDIEEGALSDGANLGIDYDGNNNYHQHHQLASFKSAPDVRYSRQALNTTMISGNNHLLTSQIPMYDLSGEFYNDDNNNNNSNINNENHPSVQYNANYNNSGVQVERPHFINIPHTRLAQGRKELSSYAVPLCMTTKRPPRQINAASAAAAARQCQSCPSSLRRKRRPLGPTIDHCVLSPNHSKKLSYCSCGISSYTTDRMQSNCNCYPAQADEMTIAPAHSGCLNCESIYSNLVPGHNQHCCLQHHNPCQYSGIHHHHHHFNQQQQQQQQQPQQENQKHSFTTTTTTNDHLNPFHQQSMQSFRSHSSRSNRSPMNYGLYESDCEDDMRNEISKDDLAMLEHQESFSRSQSAYFRPTTSVIKPVQGYDQTMARVSLKSRQRSRSQPPNNSSATNDNFHLTKSMENVEKLIKEVQNELRALKRQPLGSAHIDMATVTDNHGSQEMLNYGTTTTKMSLDENQDGAAKEQLSNVNSGAILSYTSATRRAGQFKCVGAIRKAGFLYVKKWILKRRQSIELARKQGWKRYWVCLRGTALLFHSVIDDRGDRTHLDNDQMESNQIDLLSWIQMNCSSQMNLVTNLLQAETNISQEKLSRDTFFENISKVHIEKEPKHLIIIDGSIAQPIPEHPRRDFVFCLSTTFGDAYLFQASCQLESDNWISAIHNACAASIARDVTRDEAIKLFETKIRHFELEAEKKIFLRQRLESRLTSMASMCSVSRMTINDGPLDCDDMTQDKNKLTMRTLLYQLNQQLLAVDTYIEQLQCEVYQLRCYLSSCGAQNMFYQNIQQQQQQQQQQDYPITNQSTNMIANDIPHPKSLLMHVSKPTKLLLIKLGIFTVSSLHAYIHARQDSAKSILQQIQQSTADSRATCMMSSPLELRIRSHSISETLMSKTENVRLQADTEDLLELANFKTVNIQISKSLIRKITHQENDERVRLLIEDCAEASDDRYSIQDLDHNISCNIKLNPKSNSSSIIKQVLKVLEPNTPELDFLNYYLRLVVDVVTADSSGQDNNYCVVKRKETLEDWTNYKHIELLEKVVFRIELSRSRMDEDAAAPFGISVEGQLFSTKSESLLNVYCSYIEWGSVADKVGLQDDDEFLLINGVPVHDLDLMFIECIIQDANKLRAVIRSNRQECPAKGVQLNNQTWQPLDGDGDPSGREQTWKMMIQPDLGFIPTNSQVISDEYLTSLVCPPPPSKSDAFLRTDTNILRQKSDLGMDRTSGPDGDVVANNTTDMLISCSSMKKSKSQHQIDSSIDIDSGIINPSETQASKTPKSGELGASLPSGAELAKQLLQRTERLTKLLGKDPISAIEVDKFIYQNANLSTSSCGSKSEQNSDERLQKSILELIETEYAYIRHLETISEHYMSPLEETGFLNISDLRAFNGIVLDILRVQHEFFDQLTSNIAKDCHLDLDDSCDQFDRFNMIIQQTDGLKSVENLKPILESIALLFLTEADKFKIYSSYCAAYSRLQKILHSKSSSNGPTTHLQSSSITSIPAALNTFSTSMASNSIGGLSFTVQPRELKLVNLSTIGSNHDQSAQLKQLTDFLGNLDSSSSSVSYSLAKSSESEDVNKNHRKSKNNPSTGSNNNTTTTSQTTIGSSASVIYRKSAHQQNFESYLIKPIQRIVKYPMLLNSIGLAAQVYANDSVYHDLQSAIKQMETIVNHVNDTQRIHDEYGLIFDHIERQYFNQQANDPTRTTIATLFGPHQPPITLNIAQLLYFGPVDWLNTKRIKSAKRKLPNKSVELASLQQQGSQQQQQPQVSCSSQSSRVFPWSSSGASDHYSEIIRYQTLIPVGEVQVRSVPTDRQIHTNSVTSSSKFGRAGANAKTQPQLQNATDFQWELFQCSSSNSNSSLLTKSIIAKKGNTIGSKNETGKVYLLSSPSNEERNLFLRKVRFIIRESVRNMSLPMARSPSTKSLTSKKLSTSSATSATSNTNMNSTCSQAVSLSPPPDMNAETNVPDRKLTGRESYASQAQA